MPGSRTVVIACGLRTKKFGYPCTKPSHPLSQGYRILIASYRQV